MPKKTTSKEPLATREQAGKILDQIEPFILGLPRSKVQEFVENKYSALTYFADRTRAGIAHALEHIHKTDHPPKPTPSHVPIEFSLQVEPNYGRTVDQMIEATCCAEIYEPCEDTRKAIERRGSKKPTLEFFKHGVRGEKGPEHFYCYELERYWKSGGYRSATPYELADAIERDPELPKRYQRIATQWKDRKGEWHEMVFNFRDSSLHMNLTPINTDQNWIGTLYFGLVRVK